MIVERRHGRTYRWANGKFIAVWKTVNEDDPVPEDMIEFPASINRSQATVNDFLRVVKEYAAALPPEFLRRTVPAKNLPDAVIFEGWTHIVIQPDGRIERITGVEIIIMPDNSKMLKVRFGDGVGRLSMLPNLQVVVAKRQGEN